MQYGVFHKTALILLITFSHFYPLDSMLKILLSLYVSFLMLTCYAQPIIPEWSGPSDLVVEDPNKIISDLTSLIIETTKVLLTWKVNGDTPDFFSIERSDNGKSYEVITVLNNLSPQALFQWTDDAPKKGKSFYRIRYSFKQGAPFYSKTIPVSIAGYIAFKFYPNPVDHILIVRSEAPIDVQISDATGKIRISQLRVKGLYTINVSSLEKGVYLIRFSNKMTNVMSQEKLIKN